MPNIFYCLDKVDPESLPLNYSDKVTFDFSARMDDFGEPMFLVQKIYKTPGQTNWYPKQNYKVDHRVHQKSCRGPGNL